MNGFKISPYLQEQVTFIGQMEVYGQSAQTIEKLLRTKISTSQTYRVTDTYGELIEEQIKTDFPALEVAEKDVVYGQLDGSMIFTDSGWQEVKVGRVFRGSDIEKQSQNTERQQIKASQYSAHLGKHTDFIRTFTQSLLPHKKLRKRLVLISDGARWIENWMKQNFPTARVILDYYHVAEHISNLGKLLIPQESKFQEWLSDNKERMLESEIDKVIDSILKLKATKTEEVNKKMKLIRFLDKNRYRMNYKFYRRKGLQIGSGAIEASHRTLIQDRMKKSGQRWSDRGAQNMLNLRVAFKSQRWDIVIDKINVNVA